MREEYKSCNYRDFSQRYAGTFGWFEKEDGRQVLVNLLEVNKDSLAFYDKNGFRYTANSDKGNVFCFIPPVKGCYMYGEDVVVVKRIPARQYKRGICPDNTQLYSLGKGMFLDVGFDVLETIFTPATPPKWVPGKTGILDSVFSVIGGNTLFLYETRIGTIDGSKVTLADSYKMFKQEVEDSFMRNSITMEVE